MNGTLVGLALLAWSLGQVPDEVAIGGSGGRSATLRQVRRFAYQLQKLKVSAAAKSAADLIVVDPQGDERRLRPDEVARLRRKPDGQRRLVLSYLSIGEAEVYRPYWRSSWRIDPPSWLGPENPDWPGNYKVKYWDPAWQGLILGRPDAPLNRIVDDGYDGVYLDIVDGFEFWEEQGQADARTLMVDWVRAIAAHARHARPGFLVVPQNGEALAHEPGYLPLVDAIGREDLYFEGDRPQPASDSGDVEQDLALFQKQGKPVFLIEYGKKSRTVQTVRQRAARRGYKTLITVRPLDRLIVSVP